MWKLLLDRGLSSIGQPILGVGNPEVLATSTVGVVHGRGVVARAVFLAKEPIIMAVGAAVIDALLSPAEQAMGYAIDEFPALALSFCDNSKCNIVKYINSSASEELANVWVQWDPDLLLLFVVARRRIEVGEELLAYYKIGVHDVKRCGLCLFHRIFAWH